MRAFDSQYGDSEVEVDTSFNAVLTFDKIDLDESRQLFSDLASMIGEEFNNFGVKDTQELVELFVAKSLEDETVLSDLYVVITFLLIYCELNYKTASLYSKATNDNLKKEEGVEYAEAITLGESLEVFILFCKNQFKDSYDVINELNINDN